MGYCVNHLDKKTGVSYVYESASFWHREQKHQPPFPLNNEGRDLQ